jgi:hypothetical protein
MFCGKLIERFAGNTIPDADTEISAGVAARLPNWSMRQIDGSMCPVKVPIQSPVALSRTIGFAYSSSREHGV